MPTFDLTTSLRGDLEIAYGTPITGERVQIERKSGMGTGCESTHSIGNRPTNFSPLKCNKPKTVLLRANEHPYGG